MILLMIPRTTLIQNYELVFSSSSRRRVGDFRNSALSIRDFLLTSAGEKSNDNVVGRNPDDLGERSASPVAPSIRRVRISDARTRGVV